MTESTDLGDADGEVAERAVGDASLREGASLALGLPRPGRRGVRPAPAGGHHRLLPPPHGHVAAVHVVVFLQEPVRYTQNGVGLGRMCGGREFDSERFRGRMQRGSVPDPTKIKLSPQSQLLELF